MTSRSAEGGTVDKGRRQRRGGVLDPRRPPTGATDTAKAATSGEKAMAAIAVGDPSAGRGEVQRGWDFTTGVGDVTERIQRR